MLRNRTGKSKAHAFTLIELLIVVAIIAILAAIAVPNFLEAQTRSKISRCQNDMRTLAVGLDSYFVDNNTYPRDHDNASGQGSYRWSPWDGSQQGQVGFFYLTTPISYLASLPRDPFATISYETATGSSDGNVGGKKQAPIYVLASGGDNSPRSPAYMILGMGPDTDEDTGAQDNWPINSSGIIFYDPTNGTKSNGDIYRFGGSYLTGNWSVFNGSGEDHHSLWTIKIAMP